MYFNKGEMNTLLKFEKFQVDNLIEILKYARGFSKMDSFSDSNDWDDVELDILHIKEIFNKHQQHRFGFIKKNGDRISFSSKKYGINIITTDNDDSLFPPVRRNVAHR